MERLTILRPDDWHLHMRDGEALPAVVPFSARRFGRAILMPNLKPPVTTVEQALGYRERVLAAVPQDARFEPLMTLYLTEQMSVAEVERAAADPRVLAVKLYPAGATTNSEAGVQSLEPVYGALEAMAEHGLPLLIHGEDTDPATDVFDREQRFIEGTLEPLLRRLPTLKVVLEHITTAGAVELVRSASERVAATITVHHLLLNRNAIFAGGLRPHAYCLPVLKRERHRRALVEAATSGDPKFFLGTDSAPHPRDAKESACGCAGCFTAHAAIELYAEAFDQAGALDKLEGFASRFGPAFYGLAPNDGQITLERAEWEVPASYPFGQGEVIPMRAGETVQWRLVD
ncbi:MAG: dihydroorotase [Acidobacteriota bacterium]